MLEVRCTASNPRTGRTCNTFIIECSPTSELRRKCPGCGALVEFKQGRVMVTKIPAK